MTTTPAPRLRRSPGAPRSSTRPTSRPRTAWLALLVAGAAAVAGAGARNAAAQEKPADPDLSTEKMRRLGPIHVRPFLALKDLGYDDNIRFDSARSESDTTATAGPGLSALLLTGDRGGILVSQEYDYVAFARNEDLNHWNARARARGVALLKNFSVSLEDRFTSVRERPNAEVDHRLRRGQNALTVAARSLGSGRLGWSAYARHERIDYATDDAESEVLANRLDRRERTLSLTGEMRVRPKTTLLLETAVERIEFDDPAERRDSRALSVLPGVRFDPSAAVQGELKIGVAELTARERPQSDYRGTVGEGNLSARLGGSARLKGTFTRELVFSTVAENLYFIGTRWSAAYEQFFSRRFSGEVLYGRGLHHYPEEITGSGGLPLERDDRLSTYELAVRYRAHPRLLLTATARRLERDSNDDAFDRERNLYAVGSVYDF